MLNKFVYRSVFLLPVVFLAQSCTEADSGSSNVTCERKTTSSSLVTYSCTNKVPKSACVDINGGPTGGIEAYNHAGQTCAGLGYTAEDTFLSTGDEKIFRSPAGSTVPGAEGFFANPSRFSSTGESGSQGSCNQASISTCVDYSNMTNAKYSEVKNTCINNGLDWTDGTLACSSIATGSTVICEQTAADATATTYAYDLTIPQVQDVTSNCQIYGGTLK